MKQTKTHLSFTLEEVADILAAYKNFNGFRCGALEGDDEEFCARLQSRLENAVERLTKTQPQKHSTS